MNLPGFLPAIVVGFIIFSILTHQKSPLWKGWGKVSLPRSRRVQIHPSIRVRHSDKIIHFHHWLNFLVLLLLSILFNIKVLDHNFTQGFLLGGIIQGLSDPMSRKIIYREKRNSKSYHHSFK